MWNKAFRSRNKEFPVSSAAVIADDCHDMVRQMALPLVPQRRVKGALGAVARDSGVSYSKLRKIYYRLTDHILAVEFRSIAGAYKNHIEKQERALECELEQLRSLRAARMMKETHGEFDFKTSAGAVGAVDGETSNP